MQQHKNDKIYEWNNSILTWKHEAIHNFDLIIHTYQSDGQTVYLRKKFNCTGIV